MKTPTPATANKPDDSAFQYINGINMEVAVELIGQAIAKCSAAIADEEAKAKPDPAMLDRCNEERGALRRRQGALRANDVEGIGAVFAEFGKGRVGEQKRH